MHDHGNVGLAIENCNKAVGIISNSETSLDRGRQFVHIKQTLNLPGVQSLGQPDETIDKIKYTKPAMLISAAETLIELKAPEAIGLAMKIYTDIVEFQPEIKQNLLKITEFLGGTPEDIDVAMATYAEAAKFTEDHRILCGLANAMITTSVETRAAGLAEPVINRDVVDYVIAICLKAGVESSKVAETLMKLRVPDATYQAMKFYAGIAGEGTFEPQEPGTLHRIIGGLRHGQHSNFYYARQAAILIHKELPGIRERLAEIPEDENHDLDANPNIRERLSEICELA
jgi:hypothetical protein